MTTELKPVTAITLEGEVVKKATKHKINWPDLIFYASAEDELFTDVEIITLQQHCLDNIMPDAVEFCTKQNIHSNKQDQMLAAYISEHDVDLLLREFVATHLDPWTGKLHVTVGVNKPKIDDEAIACGLSLLEKIESFNHGDYIEFGAARLFTPSDLL